MKKRKKEKKIGRKKKVKEEGKRTFMQFHNEQIDSFTIYVYYQ